MELRDSVTYQRDKRLHEKALDLLAIAHRAGNPSDLLWTALQAANRGEVWKPAVGAAEVAIENAAKTADLSREVIRYIEGNLA